jgi:OHCU decarboxylase
MNMDLMAFKEKFGAVFEHSPWVAEAVFAAGGSLLHDAESLGKRFESVFLASDPVLQLETLRAHPQLACALADQSDLTTDSISEQAGAGLDRCSTSEFDEFKRLNADYLEKFGFPFILAVRGLKRSQILDAFRRRLKNDPQTEYQAALHQTCRIARMRIEDIVGE